MKDKRLSFLNKLLVVVIMASLLLTSCSLLPPSVTDSVENALTVNDKVTISREEYERLQKYAELEEMLQVAQAYFYKDFDENDMLETAKRGMLAGLNDPYSFYYNPQEFASMWEDDAGEYAGIGIQIQASYETNLCTIMRVFTGSPALDAGLHKNDVLVKVEDMDVDAYSLQDAVDIMRGEVGTSVTIQVMRGDELLEFTIPRAHIKVNWVNSTLLEDDIGYIALYEFSGNCSSEFQSQLAQLIEKGAKSLIIDLRDNPGGWVDDAVKLADIFLPKCTVTYLEYRDGRKQYYSAKEGESELPLVMLVNENSASASEILAAAMQDYGKATIVGVNTFGKGVVQSVLGLGSEGAGMQITIAQYFTPNGEAVHGVGVIPDVEAALPEGDNGMYEFGDMKDPQLQKAVEVMKEKLSAVK